MTTPRQLTKTAERVPAPIESIPDRSIRKARPVIIDDDEPEVVPGLCRRCQSRRGFVAAMCIHCGGRDTRDAGQ